MSGITHAVFFINHRVSNSRVAAEFTMKDKKVHLSGVSFIRGQVVPLNAIRECMKRAKVVLNSDPGFPFTG